MKMTHTKKTATVTATTTTHIRQLVHNTIVGVCYCWWWWYFCYPYQIVSRFSRNPLLCLTINIIFLPLSDAFLLLLLLLVFVFVLVSQAYCWNYIRTNPCLCHTMFNIIYITPVCSHPCYACLCISSLSLWVMAVSSQMRIPIVFQQETQTLWRRKSNKNAD